MNFDALIGIIDKYFICMYMFKKIKEQRQSDEIFDQYMQTHTIDREALYNADADIPIELINCYADKDDDYITSRDVIKAIDNIIHNNIPERERNYMAKMSQIESKISDIEGQIADIEEKRKAENEAYDAYITKVKDYQDATGITVYAGDDFDKMYAEWMENKC